VSVPVPIAAAGWFPPTHAGGWKVRQWVSRGELFAALLIIPCVNGLAGRVIEASRDLGWYALTAGFNVSVIVWLAALGSIRLVLRAGGGQITAIDLAAAAAVLILTAIPVPKVSWTALTISSIYISRASLRGSATQRAALICLALTAPMLWGPALMHAYFQPFQWLDAWLISGVTGTERLGNLVQLANGPGYLMIGQACSSFHNISLAILASVTVSQIVGGTSSLGQLGWCLLACASVLAVNVMRISLIGLHPNYYDVLHGPLGSTVANWLSMGLIAVICYFGVRRDLSRA
jgi:exosortase/archaeosortase family protein